MNVTSTATDPVYPNARVRPTEPAKRPITAPELMQFDTSRAQTKLFSLPYDTRFDDGSRARARAHAIFGYRVSSARSVARIYVSLMVEELTNERTKGVGFTVIYG